MTVGSLFSGIGGFDLGFERAGMSCSWQVEINVDCRELLAAKFPLAEIHDDVRTVGNHNLSAVDVLCGGFPCQDLSVAGRRAGFAGERSGLWWEYHRVLKELRPSVCVVENVPGLLSSNGGLDMLAILGGLEELGYRWAYRVLDSRYFGVAQRRRRAYIVGCLGDRSPATVLFEGEACELLPATDQEHGVETVREVIGTLGVRSGAQRGEHISQLIIDTGGVRSPMPVENERFQGFPDDWTAGFSETCRYRMLGNAVTVPVAEWIGRRIVTKERTLLKDDEPKRAGVSPAPAGQKRGLGGKE